MKKRILILGVLCFIPFQTVNGEEADDEQEVSQKSDEDYDIVDENENNEEMSDIPTDEIIEEGTDGVDSGSDETEHEDTSDTHEDSSVPELPNLPDDEDSQHTTDETEESHQEEHVTDEHTDDDDLNDDVRDSETSTDTYETTRYETLTHGTIYQENTELEAGLTLIQRSGVDGLVKITETFKDDDVPIDSKSELVQEVIDEVIEIGTYYTETVEVTEEVVLSASTEYIEDETLSVGTEEVIQEASDGYGKVTYEQTYAGNVSFDARFGTVGTIERAPKRELIAEIQTSFAEVEPSQKRIVRIGAQPLDSQSSIQSVHIEDTPDNRVGLLVAIVSIVASILPLRHWKF